MKPTSATARALDILGDGALRDSQTIADELWPGRRFRRAPGGGPTGGQRSAAQFMGRLISKGLVERSFRKSQIGQSFTRVYGITSKGHRALQEALVESLADIDRSGR